MLIKKRKGERLVGKGKEEGCQEKESRNVDRKRKEGMLI